jgi:hypothetical protein
VLSWRNSVTGNFGCISSEDSTGVSLTRCSQPKTGMSRFESSVQRLLIAQNFSVQVGREASAVSSTNQSLLKEVAHVRCSSYDKCGSKHGVGGRL